MRGHCRSPVRSVPFREIRSDLGSIWSGSFREIGRPSSSNRVHANTTHLV